MSLVATSLSVRNQSPCLEATEGWRNSGQEDWAGASVRFLKGSCGEAEGRKKDLICLGRIVFTHRGLCHPCVQMAKMPAEVDGMWPHILEGQK